MGDVDWTKVLRRIDETRWEIPQTYKEGMRVPGVIFADAKLLESIIGDHCLEQVANMAFLPGIVGQAMAMPDIHWGYGFPVGGVAAFDADEGIISPGGIGYDVNCGVRLLRTNLTEADVRPKLTDLVDTLFQTVPSGVGVGGRVKVGMGEIDEVLAKGARWAVGKGYGVARDLDVIEAGGALPRADPGAVSDEAKKRGRGQVGTLGSGNHFLEVQVVDQIFDVTAAEAMGITGPGQIVVFVHSGSRGLGHQVCTDYLRVCERAGPRHGPTGVPLRWRRRSQA
jgi:tRNA-splicing ligase RtcB